MISVNSQSRTRNRQLLLNMISSIVAFALNLVISFFLTPFVVKKLGIEAYGFIGLASDIIGYTTLITIALNSMAGRFITIEYQQGKIKEANKYFSSVFFSNLVLCFVILLAFFIFLLKVDKIIQIPNDLQYDVKALFILSILSSFISLFTNVYSVATFIKNRLELSSIRQILGNVIRAVLIISLFGFFPAHLWYYGVTGIIMALYLGGANYKFCQDLTPDLCLSFQNYEWIKVKELVKSGVWNLISRMGIIIGQGFNLIIANVFIGAAAMGIFSVTKTSPTMILSFFGMMAGVFAPLLTQLWAQNKLDELKSELQKSIRLCGFFSNIPLTFLLVFGDDFYHLWLPSQNPTLLQTITVISIIEFVISMPLEPLWNIFTITNRLKLSTLVVVGLNVLAFVTVIVLFQFVDSERYRLFILAGSSTFWFFFKSLFFLPMYGAYCMGFRQSVFYKPLFKSIASIIVSCMLCFVLKHYCSINNWLDLIVVCVVTILICLTANSIIVLEKSDRMFLGSKVLERLTISRR